MTYTIAVAGATGAVGREMLQTLYERKFPVDKIYDPLRASNLLPRSYHRPPCYSIRCSTPK